MSEHIRRFTEPVNQLRELSRRAAHGEDAIVTARPPKPRTTVRPQTVTPHPTVVTARSPQAIAKQRTSANVSDPTHWNPRFQQGTRPQGAAKPWRPKV